MGRLMVEALEAESDLELCGRYAPGHGHDDPAALAGCEVVVELTRPDVVMENLRRWREMGLHAVVGTSGFDGKRVAEVRAFWGSGPPNCLIVPNFSVGAVLMMRLAETAAPFFAAAEVVELHHDRKADAPSGTASATAERLAAAMGTQRRHTDSTESAPGARGADLEGVRVHSVRLPGLVAHQEVLLGNPGETLTIRHDTTDRAAFLPGILLAIRRVADLPSPVTVGLDALL
jgi:4-hydroxy-tetrahydrodipicolinate reductase